jgi:DHA2 family methylenomycin A resistance protein-like MFS transporter
VFIVNVPIVAVALAVAARTVRESTRDTARRLDPPGMALGVALVATVTLAFIEAGRGGGAVVPAAIVLAVGLLAGFVLAERRAPDPMLPLALFRRRAFAAANGVAGVMNLSTLGLLFVLSLYLQRTQGHSAPAAGLAMLPLFIPLVVLAPLAGKLVARVGPRLPMAAGALVAAAGVALLLRAQPGSGELTLLPALLAWGIGLGILTPAVVAGAVGAVESDRAGLASAVNNTARQAGGAIGIAAFGAIAGPTGRAAFVTGMHAAAAVAAGLLAAAAIAALALVPSD